MIQMFAESMIFDFSFFILSGQQATDPLQDDELPHAKSMLLNWHKRRPFMLKSQIAGLGKGQINECGVLL